MIYLLKMVFFYSYVKLPEGNNVYHESKNGTYWYWSTATWSWNLRKAWPGPSARDPLQRAWRKLSCEKWMFCCVWKWAIHQKHIFNGEHSGNALNFQRNIEKPIWLSWLSNHWVDVAENMSVLDMIWFGWEFGFYVWNDVKVVVLAERMNDSVALVALRVLCVSGKGLVSQAFGTIYLRHPFVL